MWLDSEVGVGSTFGFAFRWVDPTAAGAGPSSGTDRRILAPLSSSRTTDVARTAELYLEGAGVDVVAARGRPAGPRGGPAQHPAAVVLDIRLPTMDGWDVLAGLKADPVTAEIPVVVVSMLDERGRGFALGAADISSSRSAGKTSWRRFARVGGAARSGTVPGRHRRRPARPRVGD